eukprot:TRINITY_DN9155_c0_g1_i1.p1 TRINITY_DN9155_c0_g1~~TRINITY_DN9155_c0_g1_i1.p1  ORF type:complete len:209 (+),score=38.00 TRINITY_DN9155_c0_g1_i1:91-627(+)
MASVESLGAGSRHFARAAEEAAPVPLLTAEEEMQYQRALWVNRLLKEQLATQTQGLSLKEIEEAQAEIQTRMRDAARLQAWAIGGGAPVPVHGSGAAPEGRRNWLGRSPRGKSWTQSAKAPHTSHFEVNRRRDHSRIREENGAFLQRLENVKSSFAPRTMASALIPKISPRNRLLGSG